MKVFIWLARITPFAYGAAIAGMVIAEWQNIADKGFAAIEAAAVFAWGTATLIHEIRQWWQEPKK